MSWKFVVFVFANFIASSSCYSDCELQGEEALRNTGECSYYFDLLENALLNDSDNLYCLRQTFFPRNGDPPSEVDLIVTITVDNITNGNCDESCPPSFSSSGQQYYMYEWENPQLKLKDMLSFNALVTSVFESVFIWNVQTMEYSDFTNFHYCFIDLYLKQLPCNPCSGTTSDTVISILTWAKAYARTSGRPLTLDESDNGRLHDVFEDNWSYGKSLDWNFANQLLLAGFVFLNVLVMLLMLRFVPGYYCKFVGRVNGDADSNTTHTSLSLYWGCALVLFFLGMSLHLVDLGMYGYSTLVFRSIPNPLFYLTIVSAVVCIFTKFVTMAVELIVCAFVCRRNTIIVCIPFQRCVTNVLFCCCCCCCTTTLKSKVVQTLALWGIMAVVQHITASLIPLCFTTIIQPAELFSVLALIVSTVFCIIIFVAHLLHLCQVTGRLQRTGFCIQMFAIICFIGLAIVSIAVYIRYLKVGIEFGGLGGFLGSLVPSVILSAVGWYVKKKFLDTKTSTDPNLTQPAQPPIPNLTTEADKCETVSIHRKPPAQNSDSHGEQTPLLRRIN